MVELIKDELNVKAIFIAKGDGELNIEFDIEITPELQAEGEARDIVRSIQEERKKIGTSVDERVNVTLPSWPKAYEMYIKNQAQISNLIVGDKLLVTRLSQ